MDSLNPPVTLIAKVGSILVHIEEGTEVGAHTFDWTAAQTLMKDPEVQEWIAGLRKLAFVPVKRSERAKEKPNSR